MESEIIAIFVRIVAILFAPRSAGEIYDFLFCAEQPVNSEEAVLRLRPVTRAFIDLVPHISRLLGDEHPRSGNVPRGASAKSLRQSR